MSQITGSQDAALLVYVSTVLCSHTESHSLPLVRCLSATFEQDAIGWACNSASRSPHFLFDQLTSLVVLVLYEILFTLDDELAILSCKRITATTAIFFLNRLTLIFSGLIIVIPSLFIPVTMTVCLNLQPLRPNLETHDAPFSEVIME